MSKIVLVGIDNPQSREPKHALYPWPPGCAGHRLMRYMQIDRREYLSLFTRVNLFPDCEAHGGVYELQQRYDQLVDGFAEFSGDTTFVLLGRQVQKAFRHEAEDLRFQKYSHWSTYHRTNVEYRAVAVPHPSGRNRWWNDLRNEARARKLLRRLVKEARGE